MTTLMPTDANNHPIPAMRLKENGAHKMSASNTSTRNNTAFNADTKIISLYTTEDIYIAFGDDTVTASSTDHFFPKDIYYDMAICGDKTPQYTHIAVLAASDNATVYLSEKQ